MFTATMDLKLSPQERQLLTSMMRATTISAGLARRARVILGLVEGDSYATIAAAHGVTDTYIARWKQRVIEGGLPALADLPRSGRPDRLDPRIEAKILARTQQPPPAPLTHLDHAPDGEGDRRQSCHRASSVAAGRTPTTPARALRRE